MPHESDSSRANPHNAVALTQLIRRVNNAVAGRPRPRPCTGCDNRAGSAADSEQSHEVSGREVALARHDRGEDTKQPIDLGAAVVEAPLTRLWPCPVLPEHVAASRSPSPPAITA
jgi:hypothetical protein